MSRSGQAQRIPNDIEGQHDQGDGDSGEQRNPPGIAQGAAPIAAQIIYMAAPGAIAPLFRDIPYQRVDRNKYPWVENPFA
ncbi:MAG: hypothetical protein K8J31_30655 [Anaerolineae bacterium]|nr:hypothetical protein [Anaerolineae bacterium]